MHTASRVPRYIMTVNPVRKGTSIRPPTTLRATFTQTRQGTSPCPRTPEAMLLYNYDRAAKTFLVWVPTQCFCCWAKVRAEHNIGQGGRGWFPAIVSCYVSEVPFCTGVSVFLCCVVFLMWCKGQRKIYTRAKVQRCIEDELRRFFFNDSKFKIR